MTSRRTRRGERRQRIFATVTVVGVSLIALFAVEVYLRVTDFTYELRVHVVESTAPEAEQVHRAFTIDPYLIWVSKRYYENLDRAKRAPVDIVFMGDSCTQFGKYDGFLAELIRDARGKPIHAVNLGVAGWTTHQGRKQIERDVRALQPKIVTIYYGWNDHWLSIGLDDKKVGRINASPLRYVQRLRLGQLITRAWVVLWSEKETPVVRVGEDEFKENLTAIVKKTKQIGAVPVLITAPTSHKPGREPAGLEGRWIENISKLVPLHQRYADVVRRVGEEQDAVVCDLASKFDNLLGESELLDACFYGDGIHFTERGSLAAAELLFECLEAEGLVESLSR